MDNIYGVFCATNARTGASAPITLEQLRKAAEEMQKLVPPPTPLEKLLREPWPIEMTVKPPEPPPFPLALRFFSEETFLPQIRMPLAVLVSTIDAGPSESDRWEFMCLFPLGKRAYKRRS